MEAKLTSLLSLSLASIFFALVSLSAAGDLIPANAAYLTHLTLRAKDEGHARHAAPTGAVSSDSLVLRTLDGGPPPAPSVAHACSQLTYLAARCLHPAAPLPDPPDLISCLISVSNVGLWARESLSLHVE